MSTAEEHARGTLEDLASRRRTVVSTIRTVAAFYGLDPAPWLDGEGEMSGPPAETTRARSATKAPRRATKRAARETTATAGETTTRPTDALSEAAIRTALRAGHHSAKAIEAETKLSAWKVRALLKEMRAAGAVTSTGATNSLRYALA